MVSVEGAIRKISEGLNVLTVGGLLALSILYTNPQKRETAEPKKIEIPSEVGVPEKSEVKIGEITITFGDRKGDTQEVVVAGNLNLKSELEYIRKYFEATDRELEILKRNPSAKIVCEFSDRLMRNTETKPQLAEVWEFLNKNEESLGQEFSNTLKLLMSEFGLDKDSISRNVGSPAKTGTVCGFWFNSSYSLISAEKIERAQMLSRKIFALVAKLLQEKVEKKDVEAEKVANIFRNLIFGLLPEINR